MRGKFCQALTALRSRSTFNEARALCAGSSSSRGCPRIALSPFNEARALCAGS